MKIVLPKSKNANQTEEIEIDNNSLIIIGSNGSGKSKLGCWIEKKQPDYVHRISAQRSLTFGTYIQQKSYEQATNLLLYGDENKRQNHNSRWNWDGEKYAYTSLNDYENVLSLLVALKNFQQEKYIAECRNKDKLNVPHDVVPEMVDETLKKIWNSVFPHRGIDVLDGKVLANLMKNGDTKEYNGKEMSDGERVALYLIAQALCVPKDKIIIIDEPEIHLHRSIMNRLWSEIEKARPDCLFVYITHDTQFAANHKRTKKIWMKGYDGANWEYEFVLESQLPEQLLLDLLGNRKPVIFVEGTTDSYDTKLYSEIYKDYYIVPCGSCSSVISQTKAMRNNAQLHDLICYGIIDKDYRTEYECEQYKTDGIYTLKVAEVENLFLTEELLGVVNSIMGFDNIENIHETKKYIIEERFEKQINRQICQAVVSEIKYLLTTTTISNNSEEESKIALQNLTQTINYDEIKNRHEEKFRSILRSREYKKVLEVFNAKSLSTSTGNFFGINNKGYCDFVIRHLRTEKRSDILNAIIPYLPEEIALNID